MNSIKPGDYGKKPLILDSDKNHPHTSTTSKFFFYVFNKFSGWQGMRSQSI
jgi:hypothetical protein